MDKGHQPSFEFGEDKPDPISRKRIGARELPELRSDRPVFDNLSVIKELNRDFISSFEPSGNHLLSPESTTALLRITDTINQDFDYHRSTEIGPTDYSDGRKIFIRGKKRPYGQELAGKYKADLTDYSTELAEYIRKTGNISKVTTQNRGRKVSEHFSRKKVFNETLAADRRRIEQDKKRIEQHQGVLGQLFDNKTTYSDYSWEQTLRIGEDSLITVLRPALKVFNHEIGNFDQKGTVHMTIRQMYQTEDQLSLSSIIRASAIYYGDLRNQIERTFSEIQTASSNYSEYENEAKRRLFASRTSKKPTRKDAVRPTRPVDTQEQGQLDID